MGPFACGLPRPHRDAALHTADTTMLVPVTTPRAALAARDVGADVLVVQGIEAG